MSGHCAIAGLSQLPFLGVRFRHESRRFALFLFVATINTFPVSTRSSRAAGRLAGPRPAASAEAARPRSEVLRPTVALARVIGSIAQGVLRDHGH